MRKPITHCQVLKRRSLRREAGTKQKKKTDLPYQCHQFKGTDKQVDGFALQTTKRQAIHNVKKR